MKASQDHPEDLIVDSSTYDRDAWDQWVNSGDTFMDEKKVIELDISNFSDMKIIVPRKLIYKDGDSFHEDIKIFATKSAGAERFQLVKTWADTGDSAWPSVDFKKIDRIKKST